MSVIDNIQVFNTGLTKEQIAEAFSKSLADYTKAEIDSMMEQKANEAAVEAALDEIDTALGSKVDKVTGKGLSTNDYTDTDKNFLTGLYDQGDLLQNGDDLDDITDIGAYYASLGTAATITHSPVTSSAFRLEVTSPARMDIVQKILSLPVNGKIYYRSFDGSVWSSWFEFTGTAVV